MKIRKTDRIENRNMQEEEKRLLKRLIRNDDEAYTLLYKWYYIPMVLFAVKYVHKEDVAKDLVQDVFVSMLGQKNEFENQVALKVYLYNATKNRCINHLKHEEVKERVVANILQESEESELFWDRVMEEDIYARLMFAVEQLPRQYRNVISFTLEGYKISEIAAKMNISLDTAKEYKKDGKKRLISYLRNSGYTILLPYILGL